MRGNPHNALARASTRFVYSYGRSPAYRRLLSSEHVAPFRGETSLSHAQRFPLLRPAPLRSQVVPEQILCATVLRIPSRKFHFNTQRRQGQTPGGQPKTETNPSEENPEAKAKETEQEAKSRPSAEDQQKNGQEGEKSEGKEEQKKEDLPPPPPHGDKSPWQVFMDTMQTELKASKEWNESTKALASSAHQFTESESVQRARKAYEATSGAVSSTTSNVIKTTAGAIGKGAQWTWETPVMKGVRTAANVTGDALDKATKPIRETEAYKNVKNVIDDGSSSRYGGWIEKEERRKRREQQAQGEEGQPAEVFQEDPK
jgi:mitochondrial import inner membrane translocase subunit TIM44